jgi:hypothetical protein
LAELLRGHIIESHAQRVSTQQQAQKTTTLYAFITSDRCRQLFDAIESHANKILEIEVAEQRAHTATWERRGKEIRSIVRVRADLYTEIERIIGTAVAPEVMP